LKYVVCTKRRWRPGNRPSTEVCRSVSREPGKYKAAAGVNIACERRKRDLLQRQKRPVVFALTAKTAT
jgi:hypothetical protein